MAVVEENGGVVVSRREYQNWVIVKRRYQGRKQWLVFSPPGPRGGRSLWTYPNGASALRAFAKGPL